MEGIGVDVAAAVGVEVGMKGEAGDVDGESKVDVAAVVAVAAERAR